MGSIIHHKTRCYICGRRDEALDEHHVYGGYANRKISEKYGLTVYLCHNKCHLNGVHRDGTLNRMLQAKVQRKAMKHYGWTTEEFIKIFGQNYKEEE